jgi:transcriptional regulator NrdR family protein
MNTMKNTYCPCCASDCVVHDERNIVSDTQVTVSCHCHYCGSKFEHTYSITETKVTKDNYPVHTMATAKDHLILHLERIKAENVSVFTEEVQTLLALLVEEVREWDSKKIVENCH